MKNQVCVRVKSNIDPEIFTGNRELWHIGIIGINSWLDSSVTLHWIRGNGDFKQFVANRVRKIREHGDITWRYIATKGNPADVASHSEPVTEEKQLWWRGPAWLSDPRAWPPDLVTVPTAESSDKGSLSHSPIIRRQVQCADAATQSVKGLARVRMGVQVPN